MFNGFYQGKRVLVTGHTGFKGGWISLWLKKLGAEVWGVSLPPLPNPKLGPVATVRAGNVIGGGDYAQDRIVPDCVRALTEKNSILVRNPSAVRPWQHVLECLSGYLWLGARLSKEPKTSPLASAFN